jgi:phage/plasmid-like protein (TIGR03299 family)
MAHLIDMTNSRANIAYMGSVPWHGLGRSMPASTPLDEWRIAAGLNFELYESPVQFTTPEGQSEYTDKKVIFRSDNNVPLSVMSKDYNTVQPKEIVEFFRDLINESGYEMETMGSLRGGRTQWALANTKNVASIKGQDSLKAYLMIATSCDGLLATTVQYTSIRVVCQNTLEFSLQGEAGGRLRVPHSTVFRPDVIQQQIKQGADAFEKFVENANVLADRKVSDEEVIEYFVKLLKIEDTSLMSSRSLQDMLHVYAHGKGQDTRSAKGTAWGLVNAVTRYYDHEKSARGTDTRLNSAWFGDGRLKKNEALTRALALAA